MQFNITDFSNKSLTGLFSHCSREELENKIHLFFTSRGYRAKTGKDERLYFEKGNRTLRLLFGAFFKYHKQSILVQAEGESFLVQLQRESSGMSGGLIGRHQVRKEFENLLEEFKNYFSS